MANPTIPSVQQRVGQVALAMSRVAGWSYVACALLITFDILARNLFGFSTRATVELSGYALGFGISWGLAGAFVARMHVRVDMLLERLPPRLRAWFHLLALLLLVGFLLVVAWGVLYLARDSWEIDAHDLSALQLPLWAPQALFAAGILMLLLTVSVTLVAVIALLARGDLPAVNGLMKQKSASEEAEEAIQASHGSGSGPGEGAAC